MRTLVHCTGRRENDNIREFVEHYKNLGFTNVLIYDNNRDGEEDFHDVIGDYIDSGYVIIDDWRNKPAMQYDGLEDCDRRFGNDYDYILHIDCDEYLELVHHKTVEEYLSQDKLKNFDVIRLNWMIYDDNGLVHKTEGKLAERFTHPMNYNTVLIDFNFPENNHVKCFIKTKGKMNISWRGGGACHVPSNLINSCLNDGTPFNRISPFNPYNYNDAYLKHYQYKTIEEFAKRRYWIESCDRVSNDSSRHAQLRRFFIVNEITDEKIKVFEEITGRKVDI